MPRDVWADLQRARRLGPAGLALAAARRGRRIAGRLLSESGARLWGTEVRGAALQAALRADQGPVSPAGFFLDSGRRADRIRRLRAEYPEAVQRTQEAADAIVRHRFDLLGSGPTDLGPDIDWHRDFKSGYRWDPRTFATRIRYGAVTGADVKVPWELSRLQHLPTLGKAYWLTGDARYAEEVIRQVAAWVRRNPPRFGVNWVCTMDVAIRAVNLLWAWGFVGPELRAAPPVEEALLGSLLAHGRHIVRNLERGADGITSNHYLADLVGLTTLGLCCPFFREAGGWARVGVAEIQGEMERQVHEDGADYESSIPYHRLVAELFLGAAVLFRRHGVAVSQTFQDRLERMLEFTLHYTKPNGLAPQVGDADDGRLHILADYGAWDPRDHRHLLATGGALLGRGDLWAAAESQTEEALWIVGERAPAGPVPAVDSRGFGDAGIYVMRAADLFCLVACGRVGTAGIGNHKHNDVLSVELHADGEDILVDAGSYLYTPEPAWRNRFRSTAAHNTVMVDGAEQNRFGEGGLFWLHPDAVPRVLTWSPGEDVDVFAGEHDGYHRLPDPVTHRREVRLWKRVRRLEIVDTLAGAGPHALVWNFTLAPGVRARALGTDAWELHGAKVRARLAREGASPPQAAMRAELVEAWVSPRYGVKQASTALRVHCAGPLPVVCRYRLDIV
jgi:hypothetical protein